MIIGQNTISKTKKITNTGILIIGGFYYSTDPNFYAEIIDVTETDFVVQLNDPDSCLTWVSYQAVLGNDIIAQSEGQYSVEPVNLWDYSYFDRTLAFPEMWSQYNTFAIMGFNGFYYWTGIHQRLYFVWRLNENSLDYSIAEWDITLNYEGRCQILIYRLLEIEQSCVPIPLLDL